MMIAFARRNSSSYKTYFRESAFSERIMGKVWTVAVTLLAILLTTLVSSRHFNCANVCKQAGRDHPDGPWGSLVRLNVLSSILSLRPFQS